MSSALLNSSTGTGVHASMLIERRRSRSAARFSWLLRVLLTRAQSRAVVELCRAPRSPMAA